MYSFSAPIHLSYLPFLLRFIAATAVWLLVFGAMVQANTSCFVSQISPCKLILNLFLTSSALEASPGSVPSMNLISICSHHKCYQRKHDLESDTGQTTAPWVLPCCSKLLFPNHGPVQLLTVSPNQALQLA